MAGCTICLLSSADVHDAGVAREDGTVLATTSGVLLLDGGYWYLCLIVLLFSLNVS
jgi:hypothetical protein